MTTSRRRTEFPREWHASFEGKVALVTGAASGLGFATAKAFAESGAAVALADVNEKEVQAAAKELADKGFKTLAIRCGVSKDEEVEAMVKETVAKFGRLDMAYNNAGIHNVLAETADSPRDDYDRVLLEHIFLRTGATRICRSCLKSRSPKVSREPLEY